MRHIKARFVSKKSGQANMFNFGLFCYVSFQFNPPSPQASAFRSSVFPAMKSAKMTQSLSSIRMALMATEVGIESSCAELENNITLHSTHRTEAVLEAIEDAVYTRAIDYSSVPMTDIEFSFQGHLNSLPSERRREVDECRLGKC